MKPRNRKIGARLRLVLKPGAALGPGKMDLLEGIRETGSISAAGKKMEMSYRRAWLLVDELNGFFREPLVSTAKGGHEGGGATLTALGEEVLARYREMERVTAIAIARELDALHRLTTSARKANAPTAKPASGTKRR